MLSLVAAQSHSGAACRRATNPRKTKRMLRLAKALVIGLSCVAALEFVWVSSICAQDQGSGRYGGGGGGRRFGPGGRQFPWMRPEFGGAPPAGQEKKDEEKKPDGETKDDEAPKKTMMGLGAPSRSSVRLGRAGRRTRLNSKCGPMRTARSRFASADSHGRRCSSGWPISRG